MLNPFKYKWEHDPAGWLTFACFVGLLLDCVGLLPPQRMVVFALCPFMVAYIVNRFTGWPF